MTRVAACAIALIMLTACSCTESGSLQAGASSPRLLPSARTAEPYYSAPTTPPAPALPVFEESEAMKLPNASENLQYGQHFNLTGTVSSTVPLAFVALTIVHADAPYAVETEFRVTFDSSRNVLEYALDDAQSPDEGLSLDNLAAFEALEPGNYTYELTAGTHAGASVRVASGAFCVERGEWLQLISNNLRNTYPTALAFFGDAERFMFRYKWGDGRHIVTEHRWVQRYITRTPGVAGRAWRVHADAVAYCEQAMDYLQNTYVRVRGNGVDSGIVRLFSLAVTNDGSYVSRFVTDKTYVSHHAFGTALDINAYTVPNTNEPENKQIIYDEVTNCLHYNGIVRERGTAYYDFLYTGSWDSYHVGVPDTLLNYLLYELAFYRAGFGWGYYYPHTCDAMHYTLTEMAASLHDEPDTGLRKVFEYAD
ncbi:MAG: M15 family metallopeptidase [Clostridia bacterium]|nr:M15 family metallopeptidase [Clostridia bacterium]